MKKNIIITFLVTILIWGLFPILVGQFNLMFNTKFDVSNERLNSLFSALAFGGLIITLIYQRIDMENLSNKEEVKEYLSIYQYFYSDEFKFKRKRALSTVKLMLTNKDYCDYLIQESFIVRYSNRPNNNDLFKKFSNLYPNTNGDMDKFLEEIWISKDVVDEIVNFYQLLSTKNISEQLFDSCDFYYDTWRPYLYWLSFKYEEMYLSHESNKKYNNPPNLSKSLIVLDKKLFHAPEDKFLKIEDVLNHPIFQSIINTNKK